MQADVVVIGLGTMGSLALWEEAKAAGDRADRVVGIEQYGPVHTHGSFTGESRVFRVAVHEGARYVPALLEARERWQHLQEVAGRQLFLPTGVLNVGPEDCEPIATVRQCVAENDLPAEELDTAELRERFPQHAVDEGDVAVLDTLSGGLRPELTVLSGLELAAKAGATILTNTPVTGIARDPNGGVTVTIGGPEPQTIHAGRAIVTAGSWAGRLLPGLADLLTVHPLSLTWFAPHHIELFTPDRFPVFLRDRRTDDGGLEHLFGVPTLDGFSIKASAGSLFGVFDDVAEVPEMPGADKLREIGEIAHRFFPDLNPEPVRASMHHDAFTPDDAPIVGVDDSGTIAFAAGMNGNGFKFAPLFGAWVSQLSRGETPDLYDEEWYGLAGHRARAGLA